jgi:hypothetical protein
MWPVAHVTIESVIVALYCFALHVVLSQALIHVKPVWAPKTFAHRPTKQMAIYLWVFGYLKHFLGNYLGLHTLYCTYGYACGNHGREMGASSEGILYRVSPGEGLLFVINVFVLMKYLKTMRNLNVLIPLVGFLAHSSFELLGIHKTFCDATCHYGRAF